MFAGGTAGIALVILRAGAGGSLLVCASTHGQLASLSWTLFAVGDSRSSMPTIEPAPR